jgi:hypothetical protein
VLSNTTSDGSYAKVTRPWRYRATSLEGFGSSPRATNNGHLHSTNGEFANHLFFSESAPVNRILDAEPASNCNLEDGVRGSAAGRFSNYMPSNQLILCVGLTWHSASKPHSPLTLIESDLNPTLECLVPSRSSDDVEYRRASRREFEVDDAGHRSIEVRALKVQKS